MNWSESETRTPVHRCNDFSPKHADTHRDHCLPHIAQIEALEKRGFYQETYRALAQRFRVWNDGVWNHQWHLTKNLACALCGSLDPTITVETTSLCLTCLNEYQVPWHPTGTVRPKAIDLLRHARTCSKHFVLLETSGTDDSNTNETA